MVKLKVYAQAFFDLALETGKLDQYTTEAELVIATLANDSDLRGVLVHPEVSTEKKFAILNDIFANNKDSDSAKPNAISQDFLGLFNIILTKRREAHLEAILRAYVGLVMEHKNITIAQVYTPVELSDIQSKKIQNKLQETLGKQIILDITIMPELVAGLRIIADGAVIDSSFKKQLANMKQSLYTSLNQDQRQPAKEVS